MRGIAFLVVFVAHSMPHRVLPGGFGVAIFFFLSGYLITTLLRAEAATTSTISLKDFYVRRVLRIFPPCYITLLIVSALALCGVVYNTESYNSLISGFLYFSNYWNILGWGNLPAGMGILWSLAVEEHYYVVYPLLYALFLRRSMRRRNQAAVLLVLCGLALALAMLSRDRYCIRRGRTFTKERTRALTRSCLAACWQLLRIHGWGIESAGFEKHANALAACGRLRHCGDLRLSQPDVSRYGALHVATDRLNADFLSDRVARSGDC